MNIECSSNVQYEKLLIEETILKGNYPLLRSLRIPIIPNIISTLLLEIFKISKQFSKQFIIY